jgi:eukaryotic-like serine/threonine-protein kinase
MSSVAKITGGTARLPQKFDRYLLFDQIGKGGMAEIFLARAETELGGRRLCVVKRILADFASHPQFAEMFIHEAKLAARLDHANIVQVFDLGRGDGELFIAMEYVEGIDLTDLLRRCTKQKIGLPFEFALSILAAVLRGLDYAHRRTTDDGRPLDIVHRDVSPSNVLISFEGEIKLCDFGIARANQLAFPEPSADTSSEALQGKAGYMSPEHARGEALDARSDVFAAGIVLWELIHGRRMYRQAGGNGTPLEQARRAEIPPFVPRGLANEPELQRIAQKALAEGRDVRYASAAAMLRDLEAYMSETKLVASSLKLGNWLETNFGAELVGRRRMRQRAADALEKGPPVVLTPLDAAPSATTQAPPLSPAVGPEGGAQVRRWRVQVGLMLAALVLALVLAYFLRKP